MSYNRIKKMKNSTRINADETDFNPDSYREDFNFDMSKLIFRHLLSYQSCLHDLNPF
jgi:hypothetical protein